MQTKWYLRSFVILVVIIGLTLEQIAQPNQQIVVEFAGDSVSLSSAQNTIAAVTNKLQAIGAKSIKVKQGANGVLTIDAHGVAGGYTLADDDIITAYWKTGLETAFMYPVSALKGIVATSDTVTVVHFASIVGSATDDTVTFTHAALGFEKVCKMINDACNGYPKDGRMISVYDGHDGVVTALNANPAAITLMEYAPEGGAAGMAT